MIVFADLARPLLSRPGDAPQANPRKQEGKRVKTPHSKCPVRNQWGLSACEYEVMRLTVDELLAGDEIARRLHRSHKTILAHRDRAKNKMKARSLVEAALIWDRAMRANAALAANLALAVIEKQGAL